MSATSKAFNDPDLDTEFDEKTINPAEEVIKERIEAGWSFEGYIPIETRGTGDIEIMSLIFQKEE